MSMELDLFTWWAISISGGSIFLALVSIYLYAESKTTRRKREKPVSKTVGLVEDFAFVWVLLGLLVFYIISVNIGSASIFAVGNILVEILLIFYLTRYRRTKPDQNNHT
jgi:predicted metal-binding membrane protein